MLLLDVLKAESPAVATVEVIAGENATPVCELSESWQAIANGESNTRLSAPDVTVKMAQLFHYKLTHSDVDLFNEQPELSHLQGCYSELLAQLANETLEFYAQDFRVRRYPDFDTVFRELERASRLGQQQAASEQAISEQTISEQAISEQAIFREKEQSAHRFNIARIGVDLFSEFGYDVPASFYHVHLAPLYRSHVFEARSLRPDPREQNHKRPWNAVLHAGKVFAIQAKIQSIASQYGLTYQHSCDSDSHVSEIDKAAGSFNYDLNTPKRNRWIRSYIWTMWYEYAFFGLIPNTAYLKKSG